MNALEKNHLKKFIFFLKECGVYEKFIYNMFHFPQFRITEENKYIPTTIEYVVKYYAMADYISGSFSRSISKEGSHFWTSIEYQWRNYIYYSWDEEKRTYSNTLTRHKKIK